MTVFIELVVEAYDDPMKDLTDKKWRRGAGVDSVRRPLRGLEIKDDTHAVIRVIGADSKEINLISSSYPSGEGPDYTNFILQSVSESREEKVQIIETFGDAYVFFFGERPRFLSISALLINSFDFNWKAEFWENYQKYLRGTKCAELGARVYLFYDDNIVEGYMMKAQADENAGNPREIPMQFVLFVTNARNISFVTKDATYPIRPSAVRGELPAATVAGLVDDDLSAESLPGWLARKEIPKKYDTWHQWLAEDKVTKRYTKWDQIEIPRYEGTPVRSKITDNWDEWTGDVIGYKMNQKAIDHAESQRKRRLQDEAIKRACMAGAFANNAGFLRGFGLTGPGDSLSLSNLEDAWNAAKKGDVKGVVSNLVNSNITASIDTPWGSGVATAGTNPEDGMYSGKEWLSKSELDEKYAGAGAGYHGGGAVGYNPFEGELPGPAGRPGYYAGAGYFGPNQRGVPGHGSGSAPAGVNRKYSSGAWAGWSPGGGFESGSYSYPGNQPPPGSGVQTPSSGVSGTVGFGASATAGAYVGAAAGGGAFIGGAAGGGYASGYRPGSGGNSATANNMYYAAGGASWDPDNGFQWDSTSDPNKPVPGQPGGGYFGTQAVGGSMNEQKWGPGYQAIGTENAVTKYGQVDTSSCPAKRGSTLGF